MRDEYKTLAEKMYGVIKIAAIDCLEEEELCEEFTVYDVPTILVFTENMSDDGERYSGVKEWNKIATFASQKMQNFVAVVSANNYESWVGRDQSKHKVLLFTERKTTAPLFKALSKQYKEKLLFGEVRKSEADLVARFGVTKFPTMMVLTDPQNL